MENSNESYDENIELSDEEKSKIFEKISQKLNGVTKYIEGNITMFVMGNQYFYHRNKKTTTFYLNSKFIIFINKEKGFEKEFFIHDEISFNNALKEAEIKHAILINEENKKKNYDSNDSNSSNNSSISVDKLDVVNILSESIIKIEEEKSINRGKILSKENFKDRFLLGKSFLDLDYNFKYYKNIPTNNLKILEINQNWSEDISNFYKNILFSIMFIIGPAGIGKTTNILLYTKLAGMRRLYFPIKKLIKIKDKRKWKKIVLYESLYIFKDENEMKEFSANFDNMEESNTLLEFIFNFIQLVLEFYRNKSNTKKILIIIDEYDNSFDTKNYILEIIDIVNQNWDKFLLCISGIGSFICKKYYHYLLNQKNIYLLNYKIAYWNISLNNEEKKNFFNLPIYHYNYEKIKDSTNEDTFKNIITNEIKNDFKKIGLKKFFCVSKYLNIFVDIEDLSNDFEYFPLEYLDLEIKEENCKTFIKISFKLKLYEDIYNDSIKELIEIENLKSLWNSYKRDGIKFEELIVEQLWNNAWH